MTWAEAPTLIAGAASAIWLTADGEIEEIELQDAGRRWTGGAIPLVCHAPAARRRTAAGGAAAFDILEIFAFVRPAQFVVPTPFGVARALGAGLPDDRAEQALALRSSAAILLAELAALPPGARDRAAPVAAAMAAGDWAWGADAAAALDPGGGVDASLDVWTGLEEWSEEHPRPQPLHDAISRDDTATRLAALLGDDAEHRPAQMRYASSLVEGFSPPQGAGGPGAVLAEAGTGVGKTLGYIAPASLWAEKNGGTVWISTYTRNLQRQIDQELDRLVPSREDKRRRIVLRKGRENYLCLLNFVNAVRRNLPGFPDTVRLGLLARWIQTTRDGDMTGGSLPGWLIDLLGYRQTLDLTDHRGECIYSACDHYRKCFIESSVRRARRADIVIANHALSLLQAHHSPEGDPNAPAHFVFDEGHHLFEAADSVFAVQLSCRQGEDLRRWLLGASSHRSRARGLMQRIAELIAGDGEAIVDAIRKASACLPSQGWQDRLASGAPRGIAESFFFLVHRLVLDRNGRSGSLYGIECTVDDPPEPLLEAAAQFNVALRGLEKPLVDLARHLGEELAANRDDLEPQTRLRMEATIRGIRLRGVDVVAEWRRMLAELGQATPDEHFDWFSISRVEGRMTDTGMHRHWIDPGLPFVEHVASKTRGLVITSATLRDAVRSPEDQPDRTWLTAGLRTGLRHLEHPPSRFAFDSPFDYGALTKVIVVTDVPIQDPSRVGAAFRDLFIASGGGALGIFTAIRRLRDVHARVALPLEHAGLNLYAQHVDAMDVGTLVDIFRAEEDSCLLGTDAVRDGVDVPGRSLRLIVFDRVPWPRPDLLHRARNRAFADLEWTDLITRLRLRQAFGRLVRRMDDRGVFVMLDTRLPSRMTSAFPPETPVRRLPLSGAIDAIRDHLDGDARPR